MTDTTATTTTGNTVVNTGVEQGNTFTATLPESYRNDPSFASYKSMDDLLKSHKSLESMVGQRDRMVKLLDEKSTADDINSFYKKLGRPDKPEDYGIKVDMPEGTWDKQFENDMIKVMHDSGLSKKQAQDLMAAYVKQTGSKYEAYNVAKAANMAKAEEQLKHEWGQAYEERLGMAKAAVKAIGGDALVEELNTSGWGNNIAIIKAFADISKMMAEDNVIRPSGVGSNFSGKMTPAEANSEMSKLKMDEKFMKAWTNANNPSHNEAVERMRALMEAAYGR